MTDYEKLCEDLRDKPRYKDKATLEIMDLCFLAAGAIEELQAEVERLREQAADLRDDFVDYACSGVPNLNPYCSNKTASCTDGRGWCRDEKCNGFSPKYGAKMHGKEQG